LACNIYPFEANFTLLLKNIEAIFGDFACTTPLLVTSASHSKHSAF